MATLAVACGGEDPCDSLTGPVVVTEVEVSGPAGTVAVGSTLQLQAVPRSACGTPIPDATVTWASGDPQVAVVSSSGIVTAVAPGLTEITATAEGQRGTASIRVEPAAVASVEVIPAEVSVTVADTVRFTAVMRDERGAVLGGRPVVWTTGHGGIAGVDQDGLATGVAAGATTVTATSEGITGAGALFVTAAPLPRLVFLQQPSEVRVGEPIAPAVRVQVTSPDGQPVTDDPGSAITIGLTTNPGGATLRGTLSVSPVNGVATFGNLNLDRAGAGYRLTASRADLQPATSQAFTVVEGAPATLVFTVEPTNTSAGQTISPAVEVTVRDAFGSPVTGWAEPVVITIESGPSGSTLLGTTSVVPVNGVARFTDLRLERTGGNYRLRAATSGLGAVSGTFAVTAGPAAGLAFGVTPADEVAGVPFSPAVTVRVTDAFGNAVAAWGEPVSLALTGGDPAAELLGTRTRSVSSGLATFDNLSIERAATGYRLVASSGALTGATTAPFAVAAGPVDRLAFATQPNNTSAGAVLAPAVAVALYDAFDNPVSGTGGVVSLTLINADAAPLLGTTSRAAEGGTATFNDLKVERAGTGYRLRATSGGKTADSEPFTVTPGPKAALGFLVQPPSSVRDNQDFDLEVGVFDAFGNLTASNLDVVSLRLGNAPDDDAELEGVTIRTTSQGRVTFTNLRIDEDGNGYTIVAESAFLASAESTPIRVR